MPRDEVDISNIVSSKRVPRIAQRLRDPLNGADTARAAQLSTATERSLDTADQGRLGTVTQDPLPEQVVPLKRQVDINEVEGDRGHGKHSFVRYFSLHQQFMC